MNGPCSKCGGGIPVFEPIELDLFPMIDIGLGADKYCSTCGASLWSTCIACNGTGKIMDFSIEMGPSYCSECGRLLKKKRTSNRCKSCGGRGKNRIHHICTKLF